MARSVSLSNYESVLVMDPSLGEKDQKAFFQKIKEVIQSFKGRIHHVDSWGIRKLANQNKKKIAQGLYFHFSFQSLGGVIVELRRRIRMNDQVIYHHFEKLSEGKDLEEHLKDFRQLIEESISKEKERLERIQQKRKVFVPKRIGN